MARALTDEQRLARLARDRAVETWGRRGWANLSSEQQHAAVAREFLSIVLSWEHHAQDCIAVRVAREVMNTLMAEEGGK